MSWGGPFLGYHRYSCWFWMVERRCVRLGLLFQEDAVRDAQLMCVSVVACKSHLATFDNADRLLLRERD